VPETFTPKTWFDGSGGGTPIIATELNRIESGIESMDDRTAALESRASAYRVAGAGNGTTDDRSAVAAADTSATAAGEVLLPAGIYRIASNLTVSALLTIEAGAVIKPDSGVTVTLAGGVTAPRRQVFDHSAAGLVVPKKVDFYHPAWWGPVNTTDDSATWTAMAAALSASKVNDATTAVDFGQRILAPAGTNRFFGLTLANCHLIAEKGVSIFYPSGTPTSGSMLTVGDYCTITGGYWRTNATSQAITLINYTGVRSRVENVYVVPNATNAIGISLGTGSAITPVLRDIQIHSSNVSAPVGTGIYVNSSDSEMANIWIGPCNKGIDFNIGACSITNLHVWGCNTGLSGSPDGARISNLYLDSNRGWGADFDAGDRNVLTTFYAWNNGAAIGSTGGIRLNKSGAPSSRDNILDGGVFDDNTGVGLLISGPIGTEVRGVRFGSRQVQAAAAAVCDTGVRVTSASTMTRLAIRGRRADHITGVLDDQSTSTMLDLGIQRRVLSSDQTFTSNVTLATVLSAAVSADEQYLIEGVVFCDGGQTGDVKVRLQATSATGATGTFGISGNPATSNASTTASSFNPTNAVAIAVTGGSAVTAGLIGTGLTQAMPITGLVTIVGTAGTLDVQAAQSTSDATATTVRAGSWLRLTRVA
jgi:hypothetical protein